MALSYVILAALLDEPLTGYDLAKRFDQGIGFFWKATHQQIYRELAKLEKHGWVTSKVVKQTHRPNRIPYKLSSAGRAELERWAALPSPPQTIKDEVLVRCYALDVVGREIILDDLRARKTYHRERLKFFMKQKIRFFSDPLGSNDKLLGRYLCLSAGLLHEQFQLTWIAEATRLLQNS